MASRDLRSMTPAERGRALARAVGIRRRLELRECDGHSLTVSERLKLREARLTLGALEDLDVALRGTEVTINQARARRLQLRKELGIGSSGKRTPPALLDRTAQAERRRKLAELAAIDAALRKNVSANSAGAAKSRQARARPRRVTSMVSGGLPGLGKH